MANEIIASIKFRTDDTELDTTEKKLSDIENSLKEINDPNSLDAVTREFEEMNNVIDTSSLSFSEMGKAVEQYQTIALKAGAESPIGRKAIEQAASLKDKMDRVTTSVDILSKKGVALQGALQLGTTVTAGYGAFVGITELAGASSEKFEKSMRKLMAVQTVLSSLEQIRLALAKESIIVMKAQHLWQGLTAISIGLVAKARGTQAVATGAATLATKALTVALAASGIGLLIIAAVALNKIMKEVSISTGLAAVAADELAEANNRVTKSLENQAKWQQEGLDFADELTDLEILSARERGASEEELEQIRETAHARKLQRLKEERDEANTTFTEISKSETASQESFEQANENRRLADKRYQNFKTKLRTEAVDARDEERNTERKKDEEQIEYEIANLDKIERIKIESVKRLERVKTETEIQGAENAADILDQATKQYLQAIENRKIADIEFRRQQLDLAGDAFAALTILTQSFSANNEADARRQFKIAKAFNLSNAIVNTAAGIIGQLNVPQDTLTGANFVKAGVVAATGAASIIKIAGTEFQGAAASGGGGGISSIISNLSGGSSNSVGDNEETDIGDLLNPSTGNKSGGFQPVLVVDSFTKVANKQQKIESLGSI